MALCGCNRTVGTIFLSLVTSPKVEERPLPEDAAAANLTIEVRVEASDIGVLRERQPYAGRETELLVPGVDVGDDRVFTVTARNADGDDVARARSLPFDLTGDDETLVLYLGLVGRSSRAALGMTTPRFRHTATPLPDGRVLLVGGGRERVRDVVDGVVVRDTFVVPRDAVDYAEIFDPTFGGVVTNPEACRPGLNQPLCLRCARMALVAGVDVDGSPIVGGGEVDGDAECARPVERFDRGRFDVGTDVEDFDLAESAAFETHDGLVIAGGLDPDTGEPSRRALLVGGGRTSAVELELGHARYAAAAAALEDGGGVVIGGFVEPPPRGTPPDCTCVEEPCSTTDCRSRGTGPLAVTRSIERFDPETHSFETIDDVLVEPRAYATATPLADGRVVVVGGLGELSLVGGQRLPTPRVEVVDPQTGASCEVGTLGEAGQGRWLHAAYATADGRVIVTGGYEGTAGIVAETILVLRIQPGCQPIVSPLLVTGGLSTPRAGHTVTPLENGAVLIAGGATSDGSVTDTLEVLWLE